MKTMCVVRCDGSNWMHVKFPTIRCPIVVAQWLNLSFGFKYPWSSMVHGDPVLLSI